MSKKKINSKGTVLFASGNAKFYFITGSVLFVGMGIAALLLGMKGMFNAAAAYFILLSSLSWVGVIFSYTVMTIEYIESRTEGIAPIQAFGEYKLFSGCLRRFLVLGCKNPRKQTESVLKRLKTSLKGMFLVLAGLVLANILGYSDSFLFLLFSVICLTFGSFLGLWVTFVRHKVTARPSQLYKLKTKVNEED